MLQLPDAFVSNSNVTVDHVAGYVTVIFYIFLCKVMLLWRLRLDATALIVSMFRVTVGIREG